MALTIDNILTNRVRVLLRDIDDGGIQWLDPELIEWINEACAEVARVRPEASSRTIDVGLNAGARQSIPAGATLLLEGICNVTLSDGTEGRVIRRVDREDLDKENLDWMTGTKTPVVKRYVPSKTDPRSFYVYPPHDGNATTGLRLVVSTAPTQVDAMTDAFPLPDIYAAPVANYVLFRAFGKQIESPDSQARSDKFLQICYEQLGVTDRSMEERSAETRHRNEMSR